MYNQLFLSTFIVYSVDKMPEVDSEKNEPSQ